MRRDVAALRRVWPLLGVSRRRLGLAVLAGSLALGCAIGLAATAAWLIARASQMPHILDLTVAVVAVRALGIGRGVFRYLDRLATHDVALRGAATLRERLYKALALGRSHAVAGLRRGEVLRRWGADVEAVGNMVVLSMVPAGVALVVSLLAVVLVGAFSPPIAAVLAACLLLAGMTSPLLAAQAARRAEQDADAARGAVAALSLTMLDGAAELSVDGRHQRVAARLAAAEADLRRARDRAARPAALASGVTVLAMALSVIAALLIGATQVSGGALSAVELAVVVLTPLAAFEGVGLLAPAAVHTVRAAAAARRLADLLDRAAAPHSGIHRTTGLPSLATTGLAVGWPGGEPILRNIDLSLAPGEALVIVGPNGSGKTTLLATLAGLLPPLGGSVSIGGTPSRDLADGAAADIVTLTGEDAHVFDTTMMENLRVARGDLSNDEARAAVERSGLGSLLAGMPDGLDTHVGDSGALISGGERRRLLLARALCSPAPLLLLDEPDEHLDPATADRLLHDVIALRESWRGVVVVTHRRSDALLTADRVLDLSDFCELGEAA